MNTARFLKYVWPFYNIMHERVNKTVKLLKRQILLLAGCSLDSLSIPFDICTSTSRNRSGIKVFWKCWMAPRQIFKLKFFLKLVDYIFQKSTIAVWQGLVYARGLLPDSIFISTFAFLVCFARGYDLYC